MADSLMDRIRHALGFGLPEHPSMSREQARVAERQSRIEKRQKAIDIQVDVLRADRADARRHE